MATNFALVARLHFDLAHGEHGISERARERARRQDVEHGGQLGGPAFEQNLIGLQHAFSSEEVGVVHVVEELGCRGVQVESGGSASSDLRAQRLELLRQVGVQVRICLGVQPRNYRGAVDPADGVCARERDHVALGETFAREAVC